MNPRLKQLQPYPFEKLAQLLSGIQPPGDRSPIALSIGEPRHAPPAFVLDTLSTHLPRMANYPTTRGTAELREAIAHWLTNRFQLDSVNPDEEVLPVNGTREALFSFTQAAIDSLSPTTAPLVIMPNPFYQIYEGAALLAGAEPWYAPCTESTGYLPDLDAIPADVLDRCQLFFLCTPGNPTGAVCDLAYFSKLIALADQHDFIIASDECYSEIYAHEELPPPGLLQACQQLGRSDFRHCVVFHSLSKRSNLPGLRSGFVAGDKHLLKPYLQYRTYHGCAMPLTSQLASIAAWQDETHVIENRRHYREKFSLFKNILAPVAQVDPPPASFYLWFKTPVDDETFARELYAREHITVLPGRYLSRTIDGQNPGHDRVRMALVAGIDECQEAAGRIRHFIEQL